MPGRLVRASSKHTVDVHVDRALLTALRRTCRIEQWLDPDTTDRQRQLATKAHNRLCVEMAINTYLARTKGRV